jgi:hypothetical protein
MNEKMSNVGKGMDQETFASLMKCYMDANAAVFEASKRRVTPGRHRSDRPNSSAPPKKSPELLIDSNG